MDLNFIEQRFKRSIAVKQQVLAQSGQAIFAAGVAIVASLRAGNKVLFCGNGGSAADAQHLAAELIVKLRQPRRPLPGLALTTDSSVITATGNDFSFDDIFQRQVEALGRHGDVLIANSTSGNSENIRRAIVTANEIGMITIGLLGRDGGSIGKIAAHPIIVRDDDTQRIQECHLLIGHVWMEMVDAELGDG